MELQLSHHVYTCDETKLDTASVLKHSIFQYRSRRAIGVQEVEDLATLL
jgi:hypothetical protein